MSLEDSKKKKNYSNVAPLPTKRGKLHARKAKIKQTLEPIKKAITKVTEWVKEDLKNAKPVRHFKVQDKYKHHYQK